MSENKAAGVLTLHLIALDHIEHEAQPFSPKAMAVLERLDAVIGKVWAAAERVAPGNAFVAVVSAHGFTTYDQQLNLFSAFRKWNPFSVYQRGKTSYQRPH